jgi:hypothetical protein
MESEDSGATSIKQNNIISKKTPVISLSLKINVDFLHVTPALD